MTSLPSVPAAALKLWMMSSQLRMVPSLNLNCSIRSVATLIKAVENLELALHGQHVARAVDQNAEILGIADALERHVRIGDVLEHDHVGIGRQDRAHIVVHGVVAEPRPKI